MSPRYVICEYISCGCDDPDCYTQDDEYVPVLDLPTVPVGTSIRLEFTEDGWVARGTLRGTCARCGCEQEHHEGRKCWVCNDFCIYRPAWVDAPSTEASDE